MILIHLYITPTFESCIKFFPRGELHCLLKQFQMDYLLSLPSQSQICVTHSNRFHLVIPMYLGRIFARAQLIVQDSIVHLKHGFRVSLITCSVNIFIFSRNGHLALQTNVTTYSHNVCSLKFMVIITNGANVYSCSYE